LKIVGVDLAGNPKNETGFCTLYVKGETKNISTRILHSDEEILNNIKEANPDVIAIDAPLTFSGKNRRCDELLREYGAIPVTLRGMIVLANRGNSLAKKLSGFKTIEVFATASAKILGIYDKDDIKTQKMFINSGVKGELENKFLTRDELDATFAALTGLLFLEGKTKTVGDEDGRIVIPDV